jgi:nitrate reductase gamma subunit
MAFLIGAFFVGTSNFAYFNDNRPIELFHFLTYEVIRDSSIIIFGILAIIVALSLLNMTMKILHAENVSIKEGISKAKQNAKDTSIYNLIFSPFIMIKQAISVLIFEVFGQKKQYECMQESNPSTLGKLNSKWLAHVFTIWGFIGLFVATILDMFFKSSHNEMVDVFSPIRFLGIVSGIFFLIGVSSFIIKRVFKVNKFYAKSTYEDYFILVTLWMIGFTGVVLTTILYMDTVPATIAYTFFVLHLVAFFELMIFAPFTKFAHIWYRTFALWIYYGLEKRKSIVTS